jgi:Ras-related protein Rab-8A
MSQKNITLKYLVVGDSGVGKTSLLVRYCEDTFQSDYLSTIGVDFKIKRIEVDGSQVTLNIWDTAGQERFRNITKSFYKGAHGIILTYSITDHNSFAHIESWIEQIREVGNSDTNMILVGSKADLEDDRKVTKKQGQQLADKYDLDFVETSAKDGENISKVFVSITTEIMKRYTV